MANRRFGQGMGGRPLFGGGAVNPWEGGNVPGGANRGGMNSFNSGNPSNLLSQLSEPQAQLALALTKLLQPQQQQVPSLLTMDTVNPLASNYQNDYPQRGRVDFNRRPRPDFRRNEPYNKMYSRNRDSEYNRRRDGKSGDKAQARPASKTNKTSSVKNSPKSSGKSDEVKSKEDKSQLSENSADKDTSKSDGEERTESNQEGEQKRDWKDEKNNEGKTDKSDDEDGDEKMETDDKDEKNEDSKDDTKNEDSKDEGRSKKSKRVKDGKYAGIPTHLLNCRVCQKRMWDGESFEKHMNGRAHQQMFEKVEESYRIKANMMRESIRLMEDKNSIEMDRMKRLGKKMKVQQRSHCAMCDLDFYGYLFAHRKSSSHQKLKQFLHPRCDYCSKEFPTRMEWENHRHTPEHFRKKVEVMGKEKDKQKGDEIVVKDDELLDPTTDALDELEEDSDLVLDITENLIVEDLKMRIPGYTSKRGVGNSLINEVTGFYCKPCARFFLEKEKSDLHTRSECHYKVFVKILNDKIAEAEEEKKKRKQKEEEDEANDEGNWKRRKVATSETENNEETIEENDEDPKTAKDGNDLYDPADSFNASEQNDAVLDTTENTDVSEKDEDKIWQEVDKELDSILDTPEEKAEEATAVKEEEEEEEEEKPVAVTKPKAVGKSGPRARRGRKN